MKPAPFEYVRPSTLVEACRILAQDEDARVLAGGQTLIPLLAMRLARPTMLVDIGRLPELGGMTREGDCIVVGATTRQADAERAALIAEAVPLLAKALPWVGHPATRNRRTIGGSIANADPSAEISLVAVTLGAQIVTDDGSAVVSSVAEDFFVGPMLTAIRPAALRDPDPLSSLVPRAHRRWIPRGQHAAQRLRPGLCRRPGGVERRRPLR